MSSSENTRTPRVNAQFVLAIYEKEKMAVTKSGRYADLHDVQGWNDPAVSRDAFRPAIEKGEEEKSFTLSLI